MTFDGFLHESIGDEPPERVVSRIEAQLAGDEQSRARGARAAHRAPCSAAAVHNECDYWISAEQWRWYRDVLAGVHRACFSPLHAALEHDVPPVAGEAARFFPIFADQYIKLRCERAPGAAAAAAVRAQLAPVWQLLGDIAEGRRPQVALRERALVALDDTGADPARVVRAACALIDEPDAGARTIEVLLEHSVAERSVGDAVLAKLDSASATTRIAAARYAATMRRREAVPRLVALVDDDASDDDLDALHVCGDYGREDLRVSAAALAALVQLDGSEGGAAAVRRLTEQVARVTGGESRYFDRAVLGAATQLATPQQASALVEVFHELSDAIDDSGESHGSSQPLGFARRQVVMALVRLGAREIAPRLARVCAAQNNDHFRRDCAAALLTLDAEAAVRVMRALRGSAPDDPLWLWGLAYLDELETDALAGTSERSGMQRARALAAGFCASGTTEGGRPLSAGRVEALTADALAQRKDETLRLFARLARLQADLATAIALHGEAVCETLATRWSGYKLAYFESFYLPVVLSLGRIGEALDEVPDAATTPPGARSELVAGVSAWLEAARRDHLAHDDPQARLLAALVDRALPAWRHALDGGEADDDTARRLDEELAGAIAADPDSVEPYLVYADRLLERRDPRGELIELHCRAERAPHDRALARQATAALADRSEAIVEGELRARPGNDVQLSWRHGCIVSATVFGFARELVPRLLAVPEARFLRELSIFNEGAQAIDPLTRPATLQRVQRVEPLRSLDQALLRPQNARWLVIYDHELSRLPEGLFSLARLELLEIYAEALVELPASFARLSRLRQLRLSSCRGLGALPDALVGLPSLRALSLYQCDGLRRRYGDGDRVDRLLAWLARLAAGPALRAAAFALLTGDSAHAATLVGEDDEARELLRGCPVAAVARAARRADR